MVLQANELLSESPRDEPRELTGTSAGRVLIADDEESFRESTAELLRDEGYDCLCAADADSTLDILRQTEVDAVIADIRMPGNSELEVMSEIRAVGCEAPIILVTGFPTVGSAVKSVNFGVTGYLVKPFELEELTDLLHRSVECGRGIRTLRSAASKLNHLASDASGVGNRNLCGMGRDPAESRQIALDVAVETVIELLLDLKSAASRNERSRGGELVSSRHSREDTGLDALPGVGTLTPREREVLCQLVGGDRVASIARELHITPSTVRNHLKAIFRKLEVGSQVELLDRVKAAQRS